MWYITIHDLRFTNGGAHVWRLTNVEGIKVNRAWQFVQGRDVAIHRAVFSFRLHNSGSKEIAVEGRYQGDC